MALFMCSVVISANFRCGAPPYPLAGTISEGGVEVMGPTMSWSQGPVRGSQNEHWLLHSFGHDYFKPTCKF